jgi:hypothetical protein
MKAGLIISSLVLLLAACGNRSHQSGRLTTAPYVPERPEDTFIYAGKLMYYMRDEKDSFDTLIKDIGKIGRIGNDSFCFYFPNIHFKPIEFFDEEEMPRLLTYRSGIKYEIAPGTRYEERDSSDDHFFRYCFSIPSDDSIVFEMKTYTTYFSKYETLEFRGKRIK